MYELTVPTQQIPPQKQVRSFWEKTRRALLAIVLVLLIMVVLVGAFTQTSWFRAIVRSEITSLVEKNIHGKISIGGIDGNFISGFTIHDIHISLDAKNATDIISAKEIYTRYSLYELLTGKEIAVSSIIVRDPVVTFVKENGDSLWNYERLLSSSAPSQTKSSPFDLHIDLQNFRIERGVLSRIDKNMAASTLALRQNGNAIDWNTISVRDLELDMRAHVAGSNVQHLQINNLSFSEKNMPFAVHHLELTADRNDIHTELTNLYLVTDESSIRLSARFDSLYLLRGKGIESLEHSHVTCLLSAQSLSANELHAFIPELGFMGGNLGFELDATGEFGKLNVRKGKLIFRHEGTISFSGMVSNLHRPENLFLDVKLKGNAISDRTLREYVPGLGIADLSKHGVIDIEKLTFVGPPNNFTSTLDIHTPYGSVDGSVAMDLRSKPISYDAKLNFKDANIAQLVGDPAMHSDLNIALAIKGSGTDLKTMAAEYSIDGNGATGFRNYQISRLHLGGAISHGKVVAKNTEILLTSGATLQSDYAMIEFGAREPMFDLDLLTKDLPVTELAPVFPSSSRVSVEANLHGEGLSLNNLVGGVRAEISGLGLNGKALPNIQINAALDRELGSERNRVDVITSSIADLTFKGKYNIESLGPIIAGRIKKISDGFSARGIFALPPTPVLGTSHDSVDLSYYINVKDLRPFAPFIPNVVLLGSGKIKGDVIGVENGEFTFHSDGDFHNFVMRPRDPLTDTSGLPRVRLKDTKFMIAADHIGLDEHSLLHVLKARFTLQSDSTLKLSGTTIDKPDLDLQLSEGALAYKIQATVASGLGVYLSGTGDVGKRDISFISDSLSLAFDNTFVWHNDRHSRFTIFDDGALELDTLSLMIPKPGFDPENKFAQRMRLGFKIRKDSILYSYFESPQLELSEVPRFFSAWVSAPELDKMRGRVRSLTASMSGTFSHPTIMADLLLRSFSYNDVMIDSGKAKFRYDRQTLSGEATFHVDTADFANQSLREGRESFVASGSNSFKLQIDSVPLLFNLSDYPRRKADSAAVAKREMSIRLSAHDYPIDMFSPFVPVVTDLHGLSDITLAVNGTLEHSRYKGTVDVRKGTLLLPTTNIAYDFNGRLLLSNDEMKFVNINLANLASDDPNGRGVLNGSFYFKGFQVDSFSLGLVTDRILVLSDASKESLKSIYGPLAIRSIGAPILFSGTFEKPLLSGHVGVVQGFLTLPQSDASSANLLNDGITYLIRKDDDPYDTSHKQIAPDTLVKKVKELIGEKQVPEYNDEEFEHALQEVSPNANTSVAKKSSATEEMPFQDKMLYDLKITVPNNLWFTMNLDKLYGFFPMKLIAEIRTNGSLTFVRKFAGTPYKVQGTIALTDKSSYSFIKDFSPVTGTIDFSSSLENPSLDISAEYIGQHKTSSGGDESIKIKLDVTGTLSQYQIAMELYRKNNQGDFVKDSRSEDLVRSDVLTYLTTGSFASDAPGAGSNSLASAPLSVTSQLVSGAVSNALSSTILKDYFRSFGVEYVGAQSATKFKLSGGYKNFVFNYGATYNAGVLSNDISVTLPFSEFATFNGAKDILLQGESHLGTADPSSQGLTQPPLFLFRLLKRFGP